MNHKLFIACILLFFAFILFADTPDYADGNGTIFSESQSGNEKIIVRKYVQRVEIGDLADSVNRTVWNSPGFSGAQQVHTLELGDFIDIDRIFVRTDLSEDKTLAWLSITCDTGESGWILYSNRDPYGDDTWAIIDHIDAGGKSWTVRKLVQGLAVWEVLNVRDVPGLEGSTVLFQLKPAADNPQVNIRTLGLTVETESIDGMTDCWVLMEDAEGRKGWIFGGYTGAERGGPRYLIPEDVIMFSLGFY